ncbi:MAG TPA: hypothetical protein PLO63_16805 [Syntrophales bacterium]|jgi:hypothetical protein|nr:hypothetical protein [Syntrophales bacterium]
MSNVFLFSIEEPAGLSKGAVRDLETLSSLVEEEALRGDLKRIYPDGSCYIWAVRETEGDSLATWKAVAAGDLLLGCRDHSIVSASFILGKASHPALSAKLWGGDSNDPFGLFCFTDRPRVGEVPIVPQMFRYLDPGIRGFAMLPPDKTGNILSDYGSFEIFVQLCLRYDFPSNFRHTQD